MKEEPSMGDQDEAFGLEALLEDDRVLPKIG